MLKKILVATCAILFSVQVSAQQVQYFVAQNIGLSPYEVKVNKGGSKSLNITEEEYSFRAVYDFYNFEVGLNINDLSSYEQVVNQIKVQSPLINLDTVNAGQRIQTLVNDHKQTIYYLADTLYHTKKGDVMNKEDGVRKNISPSYKYSALVLNHTDTQEYAYLVLEILPSLTLSKNTKDQTLYYTLNGFDILKSLHLNPAIYGKYIEQTTN